MLRCAAACVIVVFKPTSCQPPCMFTTRGTGTLLGSSGGYHGTAKSQLNQPRKVHALVLETSLSSRNWMPVVSESALDLHGR
ncbi:hypothetical protein VTO73DRAFT_1706 [Trametes versicolor]